MNADYVHHNLMSSNILSEFEVVKKPDGAENIYLTNPFIDNPFSSSKYTPQGVKSTSVAGLISSPAGF